MQVSGMISSFKSAGRIPVVSTHTGTALRFVISGFFHWVDQDLSVAGERGCPCIARNPIEFTQDTKFNEKSGSGNIACRDHVI